MEIKKVARSDEWLASGDCSKCRRQFYCSHGCKKHEEFVRASVIDHFEQVLVESMRKGSRKE